MFLSRFRKRDFAMCTGQDPREEPETESGRAILPRVQREAVRHARGIEPTRGKMLKQTQ